MRTTQTPERAAQAAAAVLVLLEGVTAEPTQLLVPALAPPKAMQLQRSLCSGTRQERAQALSTILTMIAWDLDEWGLR